MGAIEAIRQATEAEKEFARKRRKKVAERPPTDGSSLAAATAALILEGGGATIIVSGNANLSPSEEAVIAQGNLRQTLQKQGFPVTTAIDKEDYEAGLSNEVKLIVVPRRKK